LSRADHSPGVRKLFGNPLVSALLGGGVVAAVLLATGAVGPEHTTTVYRQSPLSSTASVAGSSSPQAALTARDIYKRDAPGVAFIRARTLGSGSSPFDVGGSGQDAEATGSGFVLDRHGHILTNAHVVDGATAVTVTFGGKRTTEAMIVGKDESTDLALLKVSPKGLELRPLALGDSKSVQVGDPTVAIGNPFGFDRTLTTGVVSALQRRIKAPDDYTIDNVIQTDAAINPGNSGGPLIDAGGRVIGINSQIATGSNGSGSVGIGFAVPIDTAKDVITELKAHGRVERPWLGVTFVPVDPTVRSLGVGADRGLLVQTVKPGGPAARAGIAGGDRLATLPSGEQLAVGGDVVMTVAGRPTSTSDDVRKALERLEPGDTVQVRVRRDGRERTVSVQLGNRPAGGADQ
jgi:S1-C subfamily serine protease